MKRSLRTTLFGVLLALVAVTVGADRPSSVQGVTLVGPHRHRDIVIRERHGNQVSSSNWGGYAITGANGSVTDVKASWTVPAVTCPSTGDQYASFWVGIDGYSSNTVEQIGTDSDCVNGVPTYYAWYEFYPHWSYNINTLSIQPYDTISAEVSAGAKGTFTVTLTVVGKEPPFSVSTKVPSANRSSAEWIVEAPWSGGVLPLADFNFVNYGDNYTGVLNTGDATIGGKTGPIGSVSFKNAVDVITMDSDSGAPKATPSPLSSDGTSFSDTWKSSGP